MGYRAQLTPTLVAVLVGLAVVFAIAYFMFPDLVGALLHRWQPSIF
jgi:hypothetical protein